MAFSKHHYFTRSKSLSSKLFNSSKTASLSFNQPEGQTTNSPSEMADEASQQPLSKEQPGKEKLVKITLAEEAQQTQKLSSRTTGSSSNYDHSAHHRCESYWQHNLYNPNSKIFRDFDKNMPCVWFTLFESKMEQYQILADEHRRNALASCLPNDVLVIVHDLLLNHSSYQSIKQRLIQWFEPDLGSRVSELLSYSVITDEKPSQFLLTLRTKLAKSDMSANMIRELFIAKMPEHLRNNLIAMANVTLDELAITADKMVLNSKSQRANQSLYAIKQSNENSVVNLSQASDVSSQIKEMENKLNNLLKLVQNNNAPHSSKGNQSNYYVMKPYQNSQSKRLLNKQPDSYRANQPSHTLKNNFCWYHQNFGSRARKCLSPCSYVSGNEPRPLQLR